MKMVNQHSYIFAAGVILLLGGIYFFRKGIARQGVLGLLAIGFGLVGLWLLVRPTQSSQAELARVDEYIGGKQPVLLEFQSPY